MTPEEPPDPIDGDTDSPVRREALRLLGRPTEELSDAEHLMRQTDRYWWTSYCLERFGAPPDRIDLWLTCREHTELQAHAIVGDAYSRLAKKHKSYFSSQS